MFFEAASIAIEGIAVDIADKAAIIHVIFGLSA